MSEIYDFSPDELLALSMQEFKNVVGAEMRRGPDRVVTTQTAKSLMDPAVLPRWLAQLAQTIESVDQQLSAIAPDASDAISRAEKLYWFRERVEERMAEVEQIQRHQSSTSPANSLADAIRAHRTATLDGEFAPTEADRTLWAHVP